MICYLWDIVKSMEEGQTGEAAKAGSGDKRRNKANIQPEDKGGLEKQMRRRIRVEVRRYFARRKRRNAIILAGTLLVMLGMFWLFGYQIGIDRVSGRSMYPYLNNGDWIVYSRLGRDISRNDVVVFEKNGEVMVKRVAGLPGDRVEINRTGSRVVVNGVQIKEEYVTLTKPEEKQEFRLGAPQTVMNGQYLVLGDNREESVDSRDSAVGTVPVEAVLGKVVWIVREER